MNSREWIEPYNRTIPPEEWNDGVCDDLLVQSRQQSHQFGEILYDGLTGADLPSDDWLDKYWTDYRKSWRPSEQHQLREDIRQRTEETNEPDALGRAYNELNFHGLNMCLNAMWVPLLRRKWPPRRSPEEHIQHARGLLASNGMHAYWQLSQHRAQEEQMRASGELAELTPEQHMQRNELDGWFRGAVNEFDGGVLWLNAILKIRRDYPKDFKNLTVLAAPMQFERAKRSPKDEQTQQNRKKKNADYIIINPADEGCFVTGAQLKFNLDGRERRRYDRTRMLMIGGNEDFGEQFITRQTADGEENYDGWGALLCAEAALSIRTYGRETRWAPSTKGGRTWHGSDTTIPNSDFVPERWHITAKGIARRLVDPTRPNLRLATDAIVPRILEML